MLLALAAGASAAGLQEPTVDIEAYRRAVKQHRIGRAVAATSIATPFMVRRYSSAEGLMAVRLPRGRPCPP